MINVSRWISKIVRHWTPLGRHPRVNSTCQAEDSVLEWLPIADMSNDPLSINNWPTDDKPP
jgi:hypothetical protein